MVSTPAKADLSHMPSPPLVILFRGPSRAQRGPVVRVLSGCAVGHIGGRGLA